MIIFNTMSGTVDLYVEKHRPAYVATNLVITRCLDSSVVATVSVIEDEFYFRAAIDPSVMPEGGQYKYEVQNPLTHKVYETGLIYRETHKTNNVITYGE